MSVFALHSSVGFCTTHKVLSGSIYLFYCMHTDLKCLIIFSNYVTAVILVQILIYIHRNIANSECEGQVSMFTEVVRDSKTQSLTNSEIPVSAIINNFRI